MKPLTDKERYLIVREALMSCSFFLDRHWQGYPVHKMLAEIGAEHLKRKVNKALDKTRKTKKQTCLDNTDAMFPDFEKKLKRENNEARDRN